MKINTNLEVIPVESLTNISGGERAINFDNPNQPSNLQGGGAADNHGNWGYNVAVTVPASNHIAVSVNAGGHSGQYVTHGNFNVHVHY